MAIDCIVSDEQADVLLHMDLRKPITPAELSRKCGKSLEETSKVLEEMNQIGIIETSRETGEFAYVLPIYIPGAMEFLCMNIPLVEKYPQIARAFEEMTFNAGKMAHSYWY